MISKRLVMFVGCAGVLAGVVSACGGTVNGRESARDQLEQDGPERCRSACTVMVACPSFQSCDCGCACPPDATDCVCDTACDCGAGDLEGCVKDCEKAVTDVLEEAPGCEDEMLAVIECVEQATCSDEPPCKAESDLVKDCRDSVEDPLSDPPKAGPSNPDPVVCTLGFGSGSAAPPSGGPATCEQGWEGCNDGSTYSVGCASQPDGTMLCTCVRDGAPEATFSGGSCSMDSTEASAACGWNLG